MKYTLSLIFILFITIATFGQSKSYDEIMNDFLKQPELKNANVALYVEELSTSKIIMEYNPTTSMIPASIFKIIPTSIALELFSPDHKFKTELAYSGTIESDGTLNGNIYIIGYGDPCLGSNNFTSHYNKDGELLSKWANEVKKLGIKKINGNIIADISYFNEIPIPDTWIWTDIANYYGNQGSALNYYDNLYYIHFSTGYMDGSETAITKTVPSDIGIDFKNYVTSSSTSGDESYIFMGSNNYEKIIRGTLPWKKTSFVIKGSMPEPELYLAKSFAKNIISNQIIINGEIFIINTSDNFTKKVFHTTYSPELQKIAEETNLKSNNMYAEVLSYHIAKKTNKTYKDAVYDFFKNKKIDTDGLNIEDACGLSHFNTVTVKQMTIFLKYLKQSSPISKSFFNTLPIAGTSGTLSKYAIGVNSKLHAKTGSMKRVRTYAGYIIDKSGNEFVFCFIVNNQKCNSYQMKKLYENLFKSIAEKQ